MGGEWRQCSLGDVVELKRGYDLPQQNRRVGSVPIVSSSGVTDYHEKAMVRAPGVVTGRYGTLGEVFYIEEDFWPLNTTLYVRDFKGNDPRFVSYFLRGLDFLAYSDKAAVPGLNRNHLHEARAFVPSDPSEQRAIAHILGTLDDKIELNRRTNVTLEAMARALFKSWFVDFDPKRRDIAGVAESAHIGSDLFPRSTERSEYGTIPSGWDIKQLADVLSELETGGRPRGGVGMYVDGAPSIGAESVVGIGIFDYSKTKYVPHEFFNAMSKGHVKNRDVLLYKDGGRPGEFEPHVTLVGERFPFESCAINEHVYRVRAHDSLGQNFLFFWLSSESAMEEMRVKGTGVAIPGLNSTQVKSLAVLVPPTEVAKAFDRLVEPMVRRILIGAHESRCLAQLRDSLLPKLISGELRVPHAEKIVEMAAG